MIKKDDIFKRWIRTLIVVVIVAFIYFVAMFAISFNAEKRAYEQHRECQNYLMQLDDAWTYDGINDDYWYWSECDRESDLSFINVKEVNAARAERNMMNAGKTLGVIIALIALSCFLRWLFVGKVK